MTLQGKWSWPLVAISDWTKKAISWMSVWFFLMNKFNFLQQLKITGCWCAKRRSISLLVNPVIKYNLTKSYSYIVIILLYAHPHVIHTMSLSFPILLILSCNISLTLFSLSLFFTLTIDIVMQQQQQQQQNSKPLNISYHNFQ